MEIETLINRLETEGFPILRKTLEIIGSVEDSRDSIPRLAEKILLDPGMSVRIIQIANSPFFNPAGVIIKTVTRAILMIGLQNIKTIALSLAIMDDILDRKKRKEIVSILARSIARAIMARNFATAIRCNCPEEIYIAGLLHDIGEMAICILADDQTLNRIYRIENLEKKSLEIIQKEVLGFSSKELAKAIAERWNLSTILKNFFSDISSKETLCIEASNQLVEDPSIKSKILASKLESFPIDTELRGERVLAAGKILKLDSKKIEVIVEESLKEIRYFLTHHFPLSVDYIYEEATDKNGRVEEKPETTDQENIHSKTAYEIDFQLLTNISYEIITLIQKGFDDPNVLFSLVMEFIFNGLNMDIVLFLILTSDRKACFVRHSFIRPGVRAVLLPDRIPLTDTKPHIFTYVMNISEPVWIKESSPSEVVDMIKNPLISTFVNKPCLVAPIYAKKHLIGFIYADNRNSSIGISEDHFVGFSIAARLTSIGLTLLLSRRGK